MFFKQNKMDDDYIYEDNECELRAEFHAFERTEIFNEDIKDLKDKVQRFKTFVSFVATEIRDDKLLDLKTSDINFLVKSVSKIPTPGYKNPTAYILGYMLLKKGYNKNTFEKDIIPILNRLTYPVSPYDVVRYARLLENTVDIS